jgi:hypothetical protein
MAARIRPRSGARGLHLVDRRLEHAVERAAPAGMGRAITPASASRKRTGWQSAVRTAMARPGVVVTMASAFAGGRRVGASSVTARAEWTWCTVTSCAGAETQRVGRARAVHRHDLGLVRRAAAAVQPLEDPRGGAAAPREEPVPHVAEIPSTGEVRISRLTVTAVMGAGLGPPVSRSGGSLQAKPGGPARWRDQGERLEEVSHFVGVRQPPVCGDVASQRPRRSGPSGQRLARAVMPSRSRKTPCGVSALAPDAGRRRAPAARRPHGRSDRRARGRQGVDRCVALPPPGRCRRCSRPVAVVDDQRRAAMLAMRRPISAAMASAGAQVSTIWPSAVSASRWASAATGRGRREAEDSAPSSVAPITRSRQPSRRAGTAGSAARRRTRWRSGKRGRSGSGVQVSWKTGSCARQARGLRRAQAGEASTRCSRRRVVKAGHGARGAQRIGHQRAAPRPQLGQHDRGRPARPGPARPARATGPSARRTSG